MERKETLKILKEQEVLGKQFRVYGTKENPLFLAKDVAKWIEHSNATVMLRVVKESEKQLIKIPTINNVYSRNSNLTSNAWFLTEDGLYEVLMLSRKPLAQAFKEEVKEILKQIRLTGGYIPVKAEDSDEMILAKALQIMQNTLSKKDELIEQQQKQIETATEKIEELEIDKKYLVGEILSKDDVTKIIMLIKRYGNGLGGKPCHFGQAYLKFYQEMEYNFGIRLKARKGSFEEKFKTDEEVKMGLQCIISLCAGKKLKTSDILSR